MSRLLFSYQEALAAIIPLKRNPEGAKAFGVVSLRVIRRGGAYTSAAFIFALIKQYRALAPFQIKPKIAVTTRANNEQIAETIRKIRPRAAKEICSTSIANPKKDIFHPLLVRRTSLLRRNRNSRLPEW